MRRDCGPNTVSRENVQRKIVIAANVAGRDLGSVVEDIRATVVAEVRLPAPPGYRVEYGGQFESAEQASRTLLILGALVVVGIFLLLTVAFRSGRDATLVMLNLPLALIGGVARVFASGAVVSVASLVGFIALFGIATRNGVMLVAHIRHLIEEGGVSDFREAVERGAMERLSPILMTALSAGLALVPAGAGRRRAGQRGPDADGHRHPLGALVLDGAQHAGGAGALPALWRAAGRGARPALSRWGRLESRRAFPISCVP